MNINRIRQTLLCLLLMLFCVTAYSANFEDVEVEYQGRHRLKTKKGKLITRSEKRWELGVYIMKRKVLFPIPTEKIVKVNGKTVEEFLKAWKERNKDQLCPNCKGDLQATCKKCNGTTYTSQTKITCPKCEGKGTIPCPVKGCKDGQAPCPGPCLRLSEGDWQKGKPLMVDLEKQCVTKRGNDDTLWLMIFTKTDRQGWSQAHVGEAYEITKEGKINKLGKCKKCSGKTTVPCKVCKTKGIITCPECNGAKKILPKCHECKDGKVKCELCKNTGLTLNK